MEKHIQVSIDVDSLVGRESDVGNRRSDVYGHVWWKVHDQCTEQTYLQLQDSHEPIADGLENLYEQLGAVFREMGNEPLWV